MYKKGTGNDKQRKDAGNRTLCPYRNFSQAITVKTIESGTNQRNLLFACQGNLNNLWLLLHHFQNLWLLLHHIQNFAFSVKTIRLQDNDIIIRISFSNLSTLETVFKSYRFQ